MARSFADPAAPARDLLAAKARHPASGRCPLGAASARGFDAAVSLLSGDWRVSDPTGFARTITTATTIGGHPVADMATQGDIPAAGVIPTLTGLARRPGLRLWWVAGTAAGHLHIEVRAQVRAGAGEPEVFALAHLLEPVAIGRRHAPPVDHSWVLVVIGDGSGQVAAVARAILDCPRRPRCCPPPVAAARFPLAALRARLTSPAIEAEAASERPIAAVLPFPSGADGPRERHLP